MFKNPHQRKYQLYLNDMIISISRITEYIGDMDREAFKNNHMVVDAVIRNFEIIGEAAKNIPKTIQDKYPALPWRKIYGLRNMVAHEYFGIDTDIIWEIATKNLPANIIELTRIIQLESE